MNRFNDIEEDDLIYCKVQDKTVEYKVCVKMEPKGSNKCELFIRPNDFTFNPFWVSIDKSAHIFEGSCLEYPKVRVIADVELVKLTNLKRAQTEYPELVVDSQKTEKKPQKTAKKKVVKEEEEEEEEANPKNEIEARVGTFEVTASKTIGKLVKCVQIEPDAQNRMYKITIEQKFLEVIISMLKQHNFKYIKKKEIKEGNSELRFRPW